MGFFTNPPRIATQLHKRGFYRGCDEAHTYAIGELGVRQMHTYIPMNYAELVAESYGNKWMQTWQSLLINVHNHEHTIAIYLQREQHRIRSRYKTVGRNMLVSSMLHGMTCLELLWTHGRRTTHGGRNWNTCFKRNGNNMHQ